MVYMFLSLLFSLSVHEGYPDFHLGGEIVCLCEVVSSGDTDFGAFAYEY